MVSAVYPIAGIIGFNISREHPFNIYMIILTSLYFVIGLFLLYYSLSLCLYRLEIFSDGKMIEYRFLMPRRVLYRGQVEEIDVKDFFYSETPIVEFKNSLFKKFPYYPTAFDSTNYPPGDWPELVMKVEPFLKRNDAPTKEVTEHSFKEILKNLAKVIAALIIFLVLIHLLVYFLERPEEDASFIDSVRSVWQLK